MKRVFLRYGGQRRNYVKKRKDVLSLPTTMKDARARHMRRLRKAWFDRKGFAFSSALRFALEMERDFELRQEDYEVMIRNCRMLGSEKDLLQVVGCIGRNENVCMNPSMARNAIAAAGRVKSPLAGFSALLQIDHQDRDIVMYNGLLQLAWKSGMCSWIEPVLEAMRRDDIDRDVFTYEHSLRSLIPSSRGIDITKERQVSKILSSNCLKMRIYDSKSDIEDVFDRIFEQYVSEKQCEELSSIRDIRREELIRNDKEKEEEEEEEFVKSVHEIILKWQKDSFLCSSLRFPDTLTSKHRFLVHDVVKKHMNNDVSSKSFNTGKNRQVIVSKEFVDENERNLRDKAHCNIFASAMMRWSHDPSRVEKLVRESGCEKLNDMSMIYAYLRCHAESGDSNSALKLISSVQEKNPPIELYNAAIRACERDGRSDDAIELLKLASLAKSRTRSEEMRKCWNAALAVCEKAEDWDAVEILMVSWPSRYRSIHRDRPIGPFAISTQRNQRKAGRAEQNPARTLR